MKLYSTDGDKSLDEKGGKVRCPECKLWVEKDMMVDVSKLKKTWACTGCLQRFWVTGKIQELL